MFSFLKLFNSKSDADKNKTSVNGFSGRTLNLNSPEAKALNVFHTRSPVARKPTRSNSSPYSSDCKDTVLSPGFSFRIAQRAREVRSTTPGTNFSNLYTVENSLNSTNTTNGNNASRDVYDKKRKLMETLDNFGVRKRTRLESGVDAIVNRRRKTISESSAPPERSTIMHECNYRPVQPVSTVKCLKPINLENNRLKKHGDHESLCQKKPRTRNNEILSSYSSSKFLLKPGQKRSYQTDHDDESPKRKHCKSCTCCGSTILLQGDGNNLNKSDKTTETDLSDELVTIAAGRIFNRSGKTQVVKKMSMKSILSEVLDDDDPTPYTSLEKVEEKKKKAQKKVISVEQCSEKSNIDSRNCSADSGISFPMTTSKFNGVKPAESGILSDRSSNASATITATIASIQPLTRGVNSCESLAKANEENKSSGFLQFNFGTPKVSAASSVELNNKPTVEVDGKLIGTDQTPESSNKLPTFQIPKNTVQISNQTPSLQSPEKNENVSSKDASSSFTLDSQSVDSSKPPIFTFGAPKPSIILSPPIQFDSSKSDNQLSSPGNQSEKSQGDQSTPVVKFSSPKIEDKSSTPSIQFGASKADDLKSPPVMQFGAPKVDGVKTTTPVMQFGTSNVGNTKSTPVMQFGAPKVDGTKSTPVVQFGSSIVDDTKSTPVMQFGAPKVDSKQSTPLIHFGAPKSDNQQPLQFGSNKESENSTVTPLFSFGNTNTKSSENKKSVELAKFQFGSPKTDGASITESKNLSFGSNGVQNQNLFSFGKTDPPKYEDTVGKSTPKLQFSALATPVFGTSNADQSKVSVNQPTDNQGPKLVFGSQTTDNKPATSSAPGIHFASNTANPIFQFNSSNSKLNDKASDTPNSSFAFSSTKVAPAFGTSAPQDFGAKPTFQFSSPKTEESKTQFSTPAFGSQNTTVVPFKFGGNAAEKPASFGNAFPSSSQPLQFTANNPEKPTAEPFKFGSAVPSSNTFQFGSANKVDNGPVKFGQNSSTFPTTGFSGFGNSAPQQTATFGSVPSPQSSPFGNAAAPSTAPAFGSAASPPSNAFGANQSFQFGGTNNAPSTSSAFAFKPEGSFNFNATPKTASPFQFGQSPPALSTSQFGGAQSQGAFGFGSPPMGTNGLPGSSQPLFSMGTAPASERRKAKAVRRRQ